MKIESLPWELIRDELNEKGFATIPGLLDVTACDQLIASYAKKNLYRKTVVMERHRFGFGEYKYFNYPLPTIIQELRTKLYPNLVSIANQWMRVFNIDRQYPYDHETFLSSCHKHGQQKPTPLILKYGSGGYNTLHQDLYGSEYFPLQLVVFLSQQGTDYEGGEFVITEQVPRSQSKATVINLQKGDALLFATSYRPVKGTRGYYRANLRHGVSEVSSGNRYAMGIIFHDATS
ncbi:2OG-Fe(II) oxygenase [Ekhidna sp.]|uniref:2OG-Fe(II) oxygenase n=1 Tax=Ekhidna sp. TaxID=2608089 RepID=UPI00329A2486